MKVQLYKGKKTVRYCVLLLSIVFASCNQSIEKPTSSTRDDTQAAIDETLSASNESSNEGVEIPDGNGGKPFENIENNDNSSEYITAQEQMEEESRQNNFEETNSAIESFFKHHEIDIDFEIVLDRKDWIQRFPDEDIDYASEIDGIERKENGYQIKSGTELFSIDDNFKNDPNVYETHRFRRIIGDDLYVFKCEGYEWRFIKTFDSSSMQLLSYRLTDLIDINDTLVGFYCGSERAPSYIYTFEMTDDGLQEIGKFSLDIAIDKSDIDSNKLYILHTWAKR